MKDDVPSLTALAVVKGLDSVSKLPQWSNLVSPEAALFNDAFIREAASASWAHRAVASMPARLAFSLAESQINTGMPLHYAARKLAVEQTVRNAIANGATQVVMISGGFDSLSLRLHKEFPKVQFYETDHPATQTTKLKALSRIQYVVGDNLHFISADLGKKSLDSVLKATPGFDPEKKTVSIAEGLTMYLKEGQVDQLLSSIHSVGGEGSQVVLSVMGSNASKGQSYKDNVVGKLQDAAGEAQDFTLDPTKIPDFFKVRGFELQRFSSYQDLQDRVGGRKLASELAWADENYYVACKTGKAVDGADIKDIPQIDFSPAEQKVEPRSRGRF